ncbi:MAG: alpha-glucosidase domain-containing protein [Bacteroidales bacterium]
MPQKIWWYLKKSLIIQDRYKPEGSWNIIDAGDAVRLETDSLTVIVDKVSLGLKFLDASGNLVLAEPVGGGKSFTRDSIDGEPVLTVQQVFAAGDEEAFFGLGQHQDRRLNLRGGTLSFNQRNREILFLSWYHPVDMVYSGIIIHGPVLAPWSPRKKRIPLLRQIRDFRGIEYGILFRS